MPLYVKCEKCSRLIPESRQKCLCGRTPPLASDRYYYVWIRRGGCKVKKSLGKVSRAYALKQEATLKGDARGPGPLVWRKIRYAYLRKLELEECNPVYLENCRYRLKQFTEYWGDDRAAAGITPQMIENFRLGLLEKKLTRTTTNRYLAAARAAWNYCVVDDLPSPFKRVKGFREDNQVTEHLTLDERARLLHAAKGISKTLWEIIMVALGTGLRKSEILNLKRDEINFDQHTLTTRTKGGKIRTVPLSDGVEQVLAGIPDNGTPWLWVSHTTRPFTKDWRRLWFKAKRLAGIPSSFRFHGLRHDFGTRILAATGNLRATQEALGHSEVRTTTRYAHVLPDYLRAAVEAADPLGAPSAPHPPNAE